MNLEQFITVTNERSVELRQALRREGEKLRLRDILTTLEHKEPHIPGGIGTISMSNPDSIYALTYHIGPLGINVTSQQLTIYGPMSALVREFKGTQVRGFYNRKKSWLQKEYENIEAAF